MSSEDHDERTDDPAEARGGSLPVLKIWWSELSTAGKVLIPTTGLVLAIVTGNALPPFVF